MRLPPCRLDALLPPLYQQHWGCVAKIDGSLVEVVFVLTAAQPTPSMNSKQPFKWQHFQSDIILLCVRWYLRHPLNYRNLEETMLERGLTVDHTPVYRWVQAYAPELDKRCRPHLRVVSQKVVKDRKLFEKGIIRAATPKISAMNLVVLQKFLEDRFFLLLSFRYH